MKLEIPNTWETKLSAKGNTKEVWEELIPTMPYMALMRNLRNIMKAGVSDQAHMTVCSRIQNQELVGQAKMFPF